MKHPELYKVTKRNGPRPAGRQDECFYCRHLIGGDHAPGCVCRQKTVMVNITVPVLVEVPEWFEGADIVKYFTGTYCADNFLASIAHQAKTREGCLCGVAKVEFLREATEEDEKAIKYRPQAAPREKKAKVSS